MRLKIKDVISIVSTVVVLLGFQNCSPTEFSGTAGGGSADQSSLSQNTTSNQNPVAVAPNTTTPVTSGSSNASLMNFVAGDQATCEIAVRNQLGVSIACRVGGGCGVSCGMPGGSCASANPTLFGVCVAPNTATSGQSACQPAGTVVNYQNCQGGEMPRTDLQSNTQAWSGCCSGNVARRCQVQGYSTTNPISCI